MSVSPTERCMAAAGRRAVHLVRGRRCAGRVAYLRRTCSVIAHVTATAAPIRLHVVPNSNRVDDQTLKLQVRDGLLPFVHELTDGVDRMQAGEVLVGHSDILLEAAREQLREAGVEYDVARRDRNRCVGSTRRRAHRASVKVQATTGFASSCRRLLFRAGRGRTSTGRR